MHIKIDQNTSAIEEVSRSTLTKLYQLSSNNMLDQSSDLIGRLHASAGYRTQVQYLNNTFDNLYVSVDDYYIPWESENTKTAVLNKLGIQSEELTEEVASTLTFPGNTSFRNNKVIESFDELKYFTSVTNIQPQYFQGSSLTSIDLRNITSLSAGYIFYDCSNLVSIKHTENILILGGYAFARSSSLQEIGSLSSVARIDTYCFHKCGLVNHVFDFLNTTQIGYYPFAMDNKKSVYLPKLTTFAANTNIYQDTDRPGITFGPDIQSFVNTGSTSISKQEYGILYLRDVTTLPCFAFTAMCGNIVINNSTPPICNTQSVSSLNCFAYRVSDVQATPFWKVPIKDSTTPRANQDITIYVPSSAYNAYLTADVWKDLPEGTIQKLEESTIYTNRVATKDAWEAAGKPDVLIEEYM